MKIVGGPYTSVEEMLRADDPDMADEFVKYRDERKRVTELILLRVFNGLTAETLALRMGWSNARIYAFEQLKDRDLKEEDVQRYVSYCEDNDE